MKDEHDLAHNYVLVINYVFKRNTVMLKIGYIST